MSQFKDNEGRTWEVAIDIRVARRVRDMLGIDLLNSAEALPSLLSDAYRLADVLYVVCMEQAEKLKVSDVDFGRGLAGDAIEHGTKALIDSLILFSPSRQRPLLQSLREKTDALAEKIMEGAEQRLESLDIDEEAQKILDSAGPISTTSPAPSE